MSSDAFLLHYLAAHTVPLQLFQCAAGSEVTLRAEGSVMPRPSSPRTSFSWRTQSMT